jgi:hypothetical protein
MKKVMYAASAALAALALSPAANAAVTVDIVGENLISNPLLDNDTFGADLTKTGAGRQSFTATYVFTLTQAWKVQINALTLGPADINFNTGAEGPHSVLTWGLNSVELNISRNFVDVQDYGFMSGMFLGPDVYTLTMYGSTNASGTFTGNISLTAVPEPATWAMMIVGVAAVGTAMRRRSQTARVAFS